VSRRTLLIGGAVVALAGCAKVDPDDGGAASATTRPPTTTPDRAGPKIVKADAAFAALENQFGARLGVWALNTAKSTAVAYNADQRFAYCSTHKVFSSAAVLKNNPIAALDSVVHYTAADVVSNSPITQAHVDSGMSVRALCEAAIRASDNTAANLLFSQLGGTGGLQSLLGSLGDTTTKVSRLEPEMNEANPGDTQDTTTPQAWGSDLQKVVLGDVLPADKRAILVDWMVGNAATARLIRAAAPGDWKVADKSGSGEYGTRNDIAVLWPPGGDPIVMVVMSSRPNKDDKSDDTVISKAAAAALASI